jgi:hypothetical protein
MERTGKREVNSVAPPGAPQPGWDPRGAFGIGEDGTLTARGRGVVAYLRHPRVGWAIERTAPGIVRALLYSPWGPGEPDSTGIDPRACLPETGPPPDFDERLRAVLGIGFEDLLAVVTPLADALEQPHTDALPGFVLPWMFPAVDEVRRLWEWIFHEVGYQDSLHGEIPDRDRAAIDGMREHVAKFGAGLVAQTLSEFTEMLALLDLGRGGRFFEAWEPFDPGTEPQAGWAHWCRVMRNMARELAEGGQAWSLELIDGAEPSPVPAQPPGPKTFWGLQAGRLEPVPPSAPGPGFDRLRRLTASFGIGWQLVHARLRDAVVDSAPTAEPGSHPRPEVLAALRVIHDAMHDVPPRPNVRPAVPLVPPEYDQLPLNPAELRILLPALALQLRGGRSLSPEPELDLEVLPTLAADLARLSVVAPDDEVLAAVLTAISGVPQAPGDGGWPGWTERLSASIEVRLRQARAETGSAA